MKAAEQSQVGRVRRPAAAIGHGVVDIADLGGFVAAGEPAAQVPVPDEVSQCRRGSVARLGPEFPGTSHRAQQRALGEGADLVGGNGAVARQVAGGIALAGDRGGLGHQVDHDLARLGDGLPLGAVGRFAPAGHRGASSGQHRHRVGPALLAGARVVAADGGGQLGQSAIQRRCIRCAQCAPELGQSVPGRADRDVSIGIRAPCAPFCGGVGLAHPPVHQFGDPGVGVGVPARRGGGQSGVDGGENVLVGDQPGAEHRHGDHPKIHLARGEGRRQLR